ncbi:polysaccharide deacetylase family protein [Modestobacter excelsi]|uniref:polysaccharide deacetylase family protein n=1 Tax=Modestobacter excelsi TaxID=2213161 RepID=UPI00110D1DEF|nr:polysaccharide deacetylase family protein [Modestobacter excelsi]
MRSRTLLVIAAVCGLLLPAVPAQAAPEPCGAGHVRLTFDDGPNRTATPDILDTLAAHGVTATFFVVGQMAGAHPALVQRESQEGHTIGNHSWDHPDLTTLARAQVESELQDTNDVVTRVTGTTPTQWRPPYGATNSTVEAAASGVGLTSMVLWTVDPRDWADPPATTVRDRVLRAVRPGSVILLHDGTGANTPEALPMILAGLADMGYCVR